MNLSRFADMETGECSFDSEDFQSLLQLTACGEAAAETDLDLDNRYVRDDLGISSSDTVAVSGLEACWVFPWDGKPILYARTLSKLRDILIDDVLFGGRESLTDGYEQRLRDAEILIPITTSSGSEFYQPRYGRDLNYPYWSIENGYYMRGSDRAADCVTGTADGNVYASYVGFPSASGAGSSFTLCESMAISASSKAKEGAWAFVRGLLLPYANVTGRFSASGLPSHFDGFAVNKETFEAQMHMGMDYWTDPYTGEVFKGANGDPVEFTQWGVCVGYPEDVVLAAYLFAPSEAQMERFWKLYESTEQITGRNDALLDIVMEQAEPYFAGDKTLEETAQLIQNRAKLYVNENW